MHDHNVLIHRNSKTSGGKCEPAAQQPCRLAYRCTASGFLAEGRTDELRYRLAAGEGGTREGALVEVQLHVGHLIYVQHLECRSIMHADCFRKLTGS